MVGLSDNQLRAVMAAAAARSRFLELMVVHLRGVHYPRDAELSNATRLALLALDRDTDDTAA
jgi:hypothetical protein